MLDSKLELLGTEALMKLSMLAEDPNLMQLFNQLVIGQDQPKTWQETEFWEVYKDFAQSMPKNQEDDAGESFSSEYYMRRGI